MTFSGKQLTTRLDADGTLTVELNDHVWAAPTGSQLVSGEPVGQMPQISGPELLLEIRRGAQPVNPANWLKL